MRKILFLFIIFFLFSNQTLFAKWFWENNHLLNIEYQNSSVKQGDSSDIITLAQLSFKLPLILTDPFILGLGLNYERYATEKSEISDFVNPSKNSVTITDNELPEDLYMTDPLIFSRINLSPVTYIYGELAPGYHSDLEDSDEDDTLLYEGLVFYGYKKTNYLEFRIGISYNESYGEPQIVPIVGIQWAITEKFAMDSMLPSYFLLRYKLTETIESGLRLKVTSRRVRLTDENYFDNDIIKIQHAGIGPYIDYNFKGSFVLRAECKYLFLRTIEFFNKSYRVIHDEVPENRWEGLISIRFAL